MNQLKHFIKKDKQSREEIRLNTRKQKILYYQEQKGITYAQAERELIQTKQITK